MNSQPVRSGYLRSEGRWVYGGGIGGDPDDPDDDGPIGGVGGGWDNAFYWAWHFIDQFDTKGSTYCATTWYGSDAWNSGTTCRNYYTTGGYYDEPPPTWGTAPGTESRK